MSRIQPLKFNELDEQLLPIFSAGDEIMGFTSNDALIMAHKPEVLKAMLVMVQAIYKPGSVDLALKKLVAVMASSAAGCNYCVAHTQFGALKEGVPTNKLEAIWDYASSELFTSAERAALELARASALSPNETSDKDFITLKEYFSDEQIVELVAVIAMFGFLNRWNSTMATDLEQVPKTGLDGAGLNVEPNSV